MSKTNKGRTPTLKEIQHIDGIEFDYEAYSKDYPSYPNPLSDPEDWTPYPERWQGLEDYLYINN